MQLLPIWYTELILNDLLLMAEVLRPLKRTEPRNHKERKAHQRVGGEHIEPNLNCQWIHEREQSRWLTRRHLRVLYFVVGGERSWVKCFVNSLSHFRWKRIMFPWEIWLLHFHNTSSSSSDYYRTSPARTHLKQNSYAQIHKRLGEIDDILPRIVYCHGCDRQIGTTLDKLTNDAIPWFRLGIIWRKKNIWNDEENCSLAGSQRKKKPEKLLHPKKIWEKEKKL